MSPVSPVVTAFARIEDVRGALTPELRSDEGTTELLLLDLGGGRARLGGSILAEVHGRLGEEAPDVDDPARLRAAFEALRSARARGWILAYHDRSDGGALVAALEMAFAGRSGLDIAIDAQGADLHATLFNEELGLLLQVRDADVPALPSAFDMARRPSRSSPAQRCSRPGTRPRTRCSACETTPSAPTRSA